MITQLEQTCWVASWPGDERGEDQALNGPHYPEFASIPTFGSPDGACFHEGCGGVVTFGLSGGFCTTCHEEHVRDEDWLRREIVPRPFTGCWVATCDGPCAETMRHAETDSVLHATTRSQAERWAIQSGWTVTKPGHAFCPDDVPELPLTAIVVLPADDQPTLDDAETAT